MAVRKTHNLFIPVRRKLGRQAAGYLNYKMNMHQRSELEQPRSLAEMQMVIDAFVNDREEYPNAKVHSRTGVIKTIIEEYLPLFSLAKCLPDVTSASLTPDSNPGPDALLVFRNGRKVTVQITCAGENESTALQRELLSDGQAVFANQAATRNRRTGQITQTGRVLTTRAANTNSMIEEVMSAIENKIRKFRQGTDILLISLRGSETIMSDDWRKQLLSQVFVLADVPYESIYVTIKNTCFECWPDA